MSALTFSLKETPAQRLDLAPLTPGRLARLSESEIANIELQTTRVRVCAGDVFRINPGDAADIRFDGGSERFDRVGFGMTGGVLHVEGDVGIHAARLMRGGTLTIAGEAGPWAASGMINGMVTIGGNVGERLGGPLAGETAGMRGGLVIVRGNAGARAADRLRRGVVVVEGAAGPYAGSRMIAGTLIVRGKAGPLPGYLMVRGSLFLARGCDALSPTFVDCGVHELTANALTAAYLAPHAPGTAALLRSPWQRLIGDMAAAGRGEIFCPPV